MARAREKAARTIGVGNGIRELGGDDSELFVSPGNGEQIRAGRGAIQLGNGTVEASPKHIRAAAPRARLQLKRRPARRGTVRRPLKPSRRRVAASLGLGACGVGQRRQTSAETGIGRCQPMSLESLPRLLLGISERCLGASFGHLGHRWIMPS